MAHDVFISYSSKNFAQVQNICDFLEQNGVKCFLAARDIPKGVEWATVLPQAIKVSKTFLVIHSTEYNDSIEVDREIKIASDSKKKIITLRIDNSDLRSAKEYYLTVINWIDLSQEKALEDLLKSILESNVKSIYKKSMPLKKSLDLSFLWFVGLFIFLFFAGFLHAYWLGAKPENLTRVAIQNIQTENNNNLLVYRFTQDIIVYDRSSGSIEKILKNGKEWNTLLGNNQTMTMEAKVGYVGIGVLLSKAFNVKVKGRNAVYYYVAATVAIVCGYGLGYYIHEKYYPIEKSNAMSKFLMKQSNWQVINTEILQYEKYLVPNNK